MPSRPRLDLTALFRDHARGLAGAVRGVLGQRADVPELLQEAFLRAWRAVEREGPPDDPVAWVFVLTLNLARDAGRRERSRGPHRALEEVDDVRLQTNEPEPLPRLAARETLTAARAAIHALPAPERDVFLLRTSGELTFEAVAGALQIPVGTAKTRMRSALRDLRARLAEHAPDVPPDVHPETGATR